MSSASLDAGGKAFLAEDPALSVNKNQCTPGKMILASAKGAHFTWGANKGTTTNTTAEIPVIGTTDLAGCIFPKRDSSGQTLNGATAKIDFRPLTTESFSEVRDNRIIQYIFGHDIPSDPEGPASNTAATGILSFNLESVSGDNLTVPVAVGDSIAIKVKGTLHIAGLKVPLEVPVALTKTDNGYNAMNNAPFSVNVRGGTQSLNTLGLDQRVTEILALVVNGTLQDVIDLNFNVDFVNLCS
ncbi:hypothetical protein [Oligoflexus tunisiensis]|uniref:hypothetical protein n=1 Tax=Oligoflexus tunisiensis TaxID=708132 RepID=UPI001C4037BF|nr:hypothetical protein [Oligoflexus tunisiensis]